MASNRVYWTSSEEAALVDKTAELIVERHVNIKWDSARIYGLADLIGEAQKIVIDKTRLRPFIAGLVQPFKNDIRRRVQELTKNGSSSQGLEAEAAPPVPPPVVPNRLGLDPKFSECLAYVCQEFSKALGEEFGRGLADKIREGVRDAVYDIRHHLGTAPGYIPPAKLEPAAPVAPPYEAVSALPEKFIKPKVGVLKLRGEQQQIIMRQFPEIDFRFLDGSKSTGTVSGNCALTFVMTKFIAHKEEHLLKGKKALVNGGITELARCIKIHFPNTRYTGLQEVRTA